jgi:predicted nucleotidyltransferase
MDEIIGVVVDVCTRLESAGMPYMISGSLAANMYAEPRFTNDADLVVQINANQKHLLLSLFDPDYYISKTAIDDAFTGIGMFNIIHNRTLFKCDLMLLKADDFSQTAFKRRVKRTMEGKELLFISVEDIILQKALWRKESNSETQLRDIKRLIEHNKSTLDIPYCKKWINSLGLDEGIGQFL